VTDPDKMNAALEFLRRTGARQVQVRYSDDEDPVVWFVVAFFDGKNPSKAEGYEVAAAFWSTSGSTQALRETGRW
jgi:hypothetical protein